MRVHVANSRFKLPQLRAQRMVDAGMARWLPDKRLCLLPSAADSITRWASFSYLPFPELRALPHLGRIRMNGSLINRAR